MNRANQRLSTSNQAAGTVFLLRLPLHPLPPLTCDLVPWVTDAVTRHLWPLGQLGCSHPVLGGSGGVLGDPSSKAEGFPGRACVHSLSRDVRPSKCSMPKNFMRHSYSTKELIWSSSFIGYPIFSLLSLASLLTQTLRTRVGERQRRLETRSSSGQLSSALSGFLCFGVWELKTWHQPCWESHAPAKGQHGARISCICGAQNAEPLEFKPVFNFSYKWGFNWSLACNTKHPFSTSPGCCVSSSAHHTQDSDYQNCVLLLVFRYHRLTAQTQVWPVIPTLF